jgi:hypothetical protein
MVQTKNTNFGTFWRALVWKMLVYFRAIWNILRPFGIFYDHLVNFMALWYILRLFGKFFLPFGIFLPFWYVATRKIWQPWFPHATPGTSLKTKIESKVFKNSSQPQEGKLGRSDFVCRSIQFHRIFIESSSNFH